MVFLVVSSTRSPITPENTASSALAQSHGRPAVKYLWPSEFSKLRWAQLVYNTIECLVSYVHDAFSQYDSEYSMRTVIIISRMSGSLDEAKRLAGSSLPQPIRSVDTGTTSVLVRRLISSTTSCGCCWCSAGDKFSDVRSASIEFYPCKRRLTKPRFMLRLDDSGKQQVRIYILHKCSSEPVGDYPPHCVGACVPSISMSSLQKLGFRRLRNCLEQDSVDSSNTSCSSGVLRRQEAGIPMFTAWAPHTRLSMEHHCVRALCVHYKRRSCGCESPQNY
jgi:hypothetical protein